MFWQLRKSRNNLLIDGKLRKYFFYAIGEIILVVAGILIALQVNNQNVERQAKLVELQYYRTMKTQLTEDRELLNDEIYSLTGRIDDYLIGIKLIADDDHDQLNILGDKVYRLLEYGDFRRKSSVYQTLIYSSEIKYIKNKDIVNFLQELERTYQIAERIEATQASLVMTHTAPVINEVLDFESRQLVSPDLVFTHSFKNRFSIAIRLADEKKREFQHALSVINNTLRVIDAELNGAS